MRTSSITSVIVLAVLILSVSAGPHRLANATQGFVHPPHRCEDFGLKKLGLFVDGEPADEFVARIREENGVARFLSDLGIDEEEATVAELLQQINDDPTLSKYPGYAAPEELQGIGGFVTALLLQRLIFVNGQPIARKVLYGRIRDYIYFEKGKKWSSHLSVDTCTDDLDTGRREFFHWDIEVKPGGFEVTPRVGNPSTSNPFPGSGVQLPKAALDPKNSNSIWERHLDRKVGANGTDIEVRHVYHRQLGSTELKRIEDEHYYTSTEESCIDLLTQSDPQGNPPATIGELIGNDYCLGRCKHPAIFNSGA